MHANGENIVVVGASYRHVPVAVLGARTLPKETVRARLAEIRVQIGAQELAYIGTCNRICFVVCGPETAETYRTRLAAVMELPLRAWENDGALEHLLLVASGLQSARRGEPEIRAQVQSAWTVAREINTAGPVLNRVFAEVLKAATEVQTFLAASIGVVSLSDGAVERLCTHLDGRVGDVAVIGVSPMTRRCALALATRGHRLTVASRTQETAESLAQEIGGTACTIAALKAADCKFDGLIAAAATGIVATADDMARWTPPSGLVAVDFGVPPNIAPEASTLPDVTLLDMDQLIVQATRDSDLGQDVFGAAREIVDRHLDRLKTEAALRAAGPAIEGVVRHHQALAKASLAELQSGTLDSSALERWTDLVARRFLHATLVGVRALATDAGPEAVGVFLRGLNTAASDEGRRRP